MNKQGNGVVVQTENGVLYKRNTTYVKKLLGQDDEKTTTSTDPENTEKQETPPQDLPSPDPNSNGSQSFGNDHPCFRTSREPKRLDTMFWATVWGTTMNLKFGKKLLC